MDSEHRGIVSIDTALLARYSSGECSPAEAHTVRQWLRSVPGRTAALNQLEQMIEAGRPTGSPVDPDAFWIRLVGQLDVPVIGIAPTKRSGRRAWGSLSVGVAGAVLLAAGIWLSRGGQSREAGLKETMTVFPASATIYTTRNKHLADIILPDGSTVTLNAASRIVVPTDFTTTRTVQLDGEALFTVKHVGANPFVVVAGNTTARVLGTAFVVRRYADDTISIVTVRDGKVAVGTSVVTALQRAEILNNGLTHVGPADSGAFTFVAGVLTLRDIPLRDAIRDLNRWYDAEIRFADSDSPLARQLVTGAFTAGPPSDLESILSFMFAARIERHGRLLTIYSK